MSEEMVVLADVCGNPVGVHPKATVHSTNTPLHCAFSCYIRRDSEVLLTRRALSKLTWPGVWTNSMCGLPAPGESPVEALIRRADEELGLAPGSLIDVHLVLPKFSYRATDSSGIVEWEICPVFVADMAAGVEVCPAAGEVDSWGWVAASALFDAVAATPFVFSPWMVEQLACSVLVEDLRR